MESEVSSSQNSLPSSRLWLLIIIGAGLFVLILVLVVWWGKRKPPHQPGLGQVPSVSRLISSPDPGAKAPELPTVSSALAKETLKDYFSRVSAQNFEEGFLENMPQVVFDYYQKYLATSEASASAKKEAARAFYIYLNAPSKNKSNPKYAGFVSDVKKDLENTLGTSIF